MAVDPYQKAKRDHHYATDFVSLQREDIVASYYRTRGWPLWKLTADGGTESFRLGDEPVCLIFGPIVAT